MMKKEKFKKDTTEVGTVEWSSFSVKKKNEDVLSWSLSDFISYIKQIYYSKYCTPLAYSPAFTNMEMSKLRDILLPHSEKKNENINIFIKNYIDWYFDNKIYQDHVKFKTWSFKNLNKPPTISLYLTSFGLNNNIKNSTVKEKIKRKSTSALILKKYMSGDEKVFIKDYGIIVPFAYLVSACNMDWPSALSYIKRGIRKCIDSSISLEFIVDVTNQYGPYDKFKKLDMSGLMSELSSEFKFPFAKVRLYGNVREDMESK
jgi:hypothetical protein